MSELRRFLINAALWFLVALDAGLVTLALIFPNIWFCLFHGVPFDDPYGLLRRTGAVWASFTLFQLVALLKWNRRPYWLTVVAGIRSTEVFSDWVYIASAEHLTLLGWLGLVIAPPANWFLTWFFLSSYVKDRRERS